MARVRDEGQGAYRVAGRKLGCPMCEGAVFETRRGVMDTRTASFLGLTWANRGSTEFICRGCGYVLTFADPA